MEKKYFTSKNRVSDFSNFFNNSSSELLKKLVFVCFTLLASLASGQVLKSSDKTPQVMEVKSFIATMKKSEQNSRSVNPESKRLENLLNDVQQTLYFYSGKVESYGDKPNSLFTNTKSLNAIASSNIDIEDIEIVTIKIDNNADLNIPIDLSVLSTFSKLNYVYILSNISSSETSIIKLIKNINPRYTVFYKIDQSE
ncbi:hypothetical protein [Flavobacterium xueshanense]|uniref:Uncharacterized protein n=1 Tax=Flavobacterium xueshanense TaxID=935223 RepID=A0A1I2IL47_9FLAO|nr:hypothetical protein [Flavobacterium xueshanense]SFF41576.1 hypothetical protein SAMN04488131_12058 [Flavobacterium xueshanense]